ncbi:glycosyl transferase group 1 [Fischerella thermalis WC542]|jgi:glycosyltransferase involved in cell wall biosynthesis|uniref:Glycosyl transferase group 1 n=1 Tax=Fischerella thermalis JSC-11 TaxID=741277 RepID=G6FSV1_9CYAN|nr:glycosyltransferase [Fischerella thermalis]EHC14937.1 glycosyl transferase group 1 [Fischerella thermalis JSC-11]PLZ05868.1 glycosyl transferase group 1 [Fischerella thermalis WC114]PLZ06059.1 glycosyl transferase group 1 [Fischerella thermalis WC119]PLZ20920.1 glycosyl transferase group 1 [Fischerella thermalis WC157]PLZ21295.1 glycosyl transferase group 1 [Fischerella thermalis WC559]
MKVAIISKSDRKGGGASRVAEDLAIWLNDAGHPTDHFIAFNFKEPLSFQYSLYGEGLKFRLCKTVHRKTNKYGFRELLPVEYWVKVNAILNDYDIVHFHDLYTAISPVTLALASRRKPTFFTVHDCSAFTGGCLYPMGCEKFASYCHKCPQLSQDGWKNQLRDRTREVQAIKRWVAGKFNIRYIFPSHWMLQEAQKALKFQSLPVVIPNGLDLSFFPIVKKVEAKTSLGIPENRRVVAISAHVLDDPRKGVKYAIAALQSIGDLSPFVIVVGLCNDELKHSLKGLEYKEMGYICDPHLLAKAYSAADVMLFCTLADNLPLTVLEAMAASTPVVGFSTGGVPEIIQNGHNGILVEPTNQQALNQALRQVLSASDLEAIGQQARRDIENKFSRTVFLEKHLQLYQNFVTNNSSDQKNLQ